MKYFLTLKNGCSQGLDATELRDEFIIQDENELNLFEITVLNDLEGTESLICKCLTDVQASDLYRIFSSADLASQVYEYLCNFLEDLCVTGEGSSGCEFFADLFENTSKFQLTFLTPDED